ncbi:MAG: DsbA family oxidoreductase [Ilumatobacteraceae bacterium]
MTVSLHVEIWSDVVCPWCYIGKRRFERAVTEVAGEIDVRSVYRPYQLDPTAPVGSPTPVPEVYARKFGGADRAEQILRNVTATAADEGLDFRLEQALRANTRDAHRVLWLAEQRAGAEVQAAVKEQLLRAYFTEGADVGDHDVLADRAAAAGLVRGEVAELLATTAGGDEVDQLFRDAHEQGITAVPTYVIEDSWAIPGAQESDTFVQVLRRMAERRADTSV